MSSAEPSRWNRLLTGSNLKLDQVSVEGHGSRTEVGEGINALREVGNRRSNASGRTAYFFYTLTDEDAEDDEEKVGW